ncbi:MAG: type I-G CRISPR-associated protein Cas8g1/Csx17, partial [Vicinamibacteria bacterium]
MESGFFSLKSPDASTEACAETAHVPGASEGHENADGVPDDELDDDDQQATEEGDHTDQALGDPLLDRFARSSAQRLSSFRSAIEVARAAISSELRGAEKDAGRAHAEISAGSAAERVKHAEALKELATEESIVAELKLEVEAKKAAVKGLPKEAPERKALEQVTERLAQAKERQTAVKKKTKDLAGELNRSERRAKKDSGAQAGIKAAKKRFKEIQKMTKERLIADVRVNWGVESREWLDAAIALDQEGKAGFTSLFGSGGNDGRMEFTKNLRYHLDSLFDLDTGAPRDEAAARFRAAIFGHPTNLLVHKAVGQYFPGRAGGTNMSAGFEGDALVNPWEFVLMLEGAVALVAGLSRRGNVEKARVSSPFWVEAVSAGFGSASQHEGSPRGEQWLPLWSQPMRYDELAELLREGRAQVGRQQATRAGDLVRATARLGLARGIDSLRRFAYLERNGQSNLAVSTGRFRVASRRHQELLDDVTLWIDELVRHAKDKNAPASLGVVARRATEALFTVCRQEAAGTLWRE